MAAKTLGYQWKDVVFDPKLSVEVMRKFARMSGTDTLAHTCIEPNGPLFDLGMKAKFVDDNYSNMMSKFYNDPEDIDKKEFYNPRKEEECPMFWKTSMGKIKLMAEVENEYLTHTFTWSIMTSAGHLRGVEQLLMDFMLEPDLAKKVMEKTGVFIDDVVRTGLEFGADAAYIADPSASGSLINADMFREFCSPYIKPIIEGWKKDFGAYIYLHVCGETEPVVEAFKEIKPSLFSFDFMTNLKKIKTGIMLDQKKEKSMAAHRAVAANSCWDAETDIFRRLRRRATNFVKLEIVSIDSTTFTHSHMMRGIERACTNMSPCTGLLSHSIDSIFRT